MARDDFDGRGRDERSRDDRYGQDIPPGREGSTDRAPYGGALHGQGRGRDASRDRYQGSGDERDLGYGDDSARRDRMDTTGRDGGAPGGRYDRDDYEGGFSRQGLRGGRGEGAGRDAAYDRDDARYDAYGADGSLRDRGREGTMGGSMGANAGWRDAGRDRPRDTAAMQGGGGFSGRPDGADETRQSGGNWFSGAHGGAPDRNPGQGFGGYGYSNADEPVARGGQGGGRDHAYRDHSGRGPRNYQRSDERIRDDVCERLTRHREIDASDIDIEVRAGVVTLSGQVEDKHAKRLAEDIAEEVMGVAEVRNELRTARGGVRGALPGHASAQHADDRHERDVTRDASRDAVREGGREAGSGASGVARTGTAAGAPPSDLGSAGVATAGPSGAAGALDARSASAPTAPGATTGRTDGRRGRGTTTDG